MILSDRRLRRLEFLFLAALSALAAWLFRDRTLDLAVARLFYHPENPADPWFEQNDVLWEFFYRAAPWLTAVLLLGSLTVLCASLLKEHYQKYRAPAIFVFLVVALGPGLFVNAVFKPYWGRPRPREVVELGGKHEYRPFYSPAVGAPGKSFPCGHCSVAFSFGAGWWLLRRRRPVLAASGLAGSIAFGTMMGVGRIAAGGHFLSDVVWAGLIVLWISYWLFHHVVAGVAVMGAMLERRRRLTMAIYAVAGVATVLTILVASPFHAEVHVALPASDARDVAAKAAPIRVEIENSRVDLAMDETQAQGIRLDGYAKGFGFPGGRVLADCAREAGFCQVRRRGFFSDYESVIRVVVNPRVVPLLHVRVRQGEIFRESAAPLPQGYKLETD